MALLERGRSASPYFRESASPSTSRIRNQNELDDNKSNNRSRSNSRGRTRKKTQHEENRSEYRYRLSPNAVERHHHFLVDTIPTRLTRSCSTSPQRIERIRSQSQQHIPKKSDFYSKSISHGYRNWQPYNFVRADINEKRLKNKKIIEPQQQKRKHKSKSKWLHCIGHTADSDLEDSDEYCEQKPASYSCRNWESYGLQKNAISSANTVDSSLKEKHFEIRKNESQKVVWSKHNREYEEIPTKPENSSRKSYLEPIDSDLDLLPSTSGAYRMPRRHRNKHDFMQDVLDDLSVPRYSCKRILSDYEKYGSDGSEPEKNDNLSFADTMDSMELYKSVSKGIVNVRDTVDRFERQAFGKQNKEHNENWNMNSNYDLKPKAEQVDDMHEDQLSAHKDHYLNHMESYANNWNIDTLDLINEFNIKEGCNQVNQILIHVSQKEEIENKLLNSPTYVEMNSSTLQQTTQEQNEEQNEERNEEQNDEENENNYNTSESEPLSEIYENDTTTSDREEQTVEATEETTEKTAEETNDNTKTESTHEQINESLAETVDNNSLISKKFVENADITAEEPKKVEELDKSKEKVRIKVEVQKPDNKLKQKEVMSPTTSRNANRNNLSSPRRNRNDVFTRLSTPSRSNQNRVNTNRTSSPARVHQKTTKKWRAPIVPPVPDVTKPEYVLGQNSKKRNR